MREKEQSNLTVASTRRFTLPKSIVLRGDTNFKRLFSSSKTLSSASVSLKYKVELANTPDFKVAFIAPKKIGGAIKRNKTKRLLREAYRLNQYIVNTFIETPMEIHIAFLAKSIHTDFSVIQNEVVSLLHKLNFKIAEHSHLNT
jgi:ribonuclease P protein component